MSKHYTLSNGLRVILEREENSFSTSLGIWIKAGSMLEKNSENGLSHFMEHMAFKGTENRSATKLAKDMDALGGQVNAATSRTNTIYYARVLPREIEKALFLLADIVLNPLVEEDAFQKEKLIISEEISMVEDSPEESVFDLINQSLYEGTGLAHTILGDREQLMGFKREELVNFRQRFYKPKNAVFVAVGSFDYENMLSQVEKAFGTWRGNSNADYPIYTVQDKAKQIYVHKSIEQTHISLGFEGYKEGDDRLYQLSLLSTILGGGLSSRLFQSIREELALVYQIYTTFTSYPGCGDFLIYAACKHESLEKVREEIIKQVEDLKKNGISDWELDYAKTQVKTEIVIANESITHRMHELGDHELSRIRHLTLAETLSKVDAVTKDDVISTARSKLLFPCASAIIGQSQ